jgi:hypothetical protein
VGDHRILARLSDFEVGLVQIRHQNRPRMRTNEV